MNIEVLNEKADELSSCKDHIEFVSLSEEFLYLVKRAEFKKEYRENEESILLQAQLIIGNNKFNPSVNTKKEVKKEVSYLLDLIENEN